MTYRVAGHYKQITWLLSHNYKGQSDRRQEGRHYHSSLLYSAILCSRADSLRTCRMWFWMSECSLFVTRIFPRKWCTDSTLWLLQGLSHVKLLPSRRKFCVHHSTYTNAEDIASLSAPSRHDAARAGKRWWWWGWRCLLTLLLHSQLPVEKRIPLFNHLRNWHTY